MYSILPEDVPWWSNEVLCNGRAVGIDICAADCVPASKEKYFPSSRPGHIGKWTAASNEMSYQMN